VKQNGDVYPCCQSYMLDGAPLGNIAEQPLSRLWNGAEIVRMRRAHTQGRAGEIDICARCCTTIPHPALVAGSLLFHGKTVRRLLPAIERLIYFSKWSRNLLRPPAPVAASEDLVQIQSEPPAVATRSAVTSSGPPRQRAGQVPTRPPDQ
jgi:hypothetical protein